MEKEFSASLPSTLCENLDINKFGRIEELVCDENSFYDETKYEEMLELYYFMDKDQKSCFKAFMKLKEAKKRRKTYERNETNQGKREFID